MGTAILISDKIDFKTKAIKKYYIMIKKNQYKKRILHLLTYMHSI